MSTGAPTVKVKLEAEDKDVLSTLDSVAVKMTGLSSAVDIAKKAWDLLKQAMEVAYDTLVEWSELSAAQERSLVQLQAALDATGKSTQATSRGIAEIAAELQRVTKFGDEVTIEASKWFAQMPSLDVQNMREYMASAQDLAEVMGTSLTVASQVLARALEDPRRASRALRRANIMLSTEQRRMLEVFDEAGMKAEAQALIMDAVSNSVGGAAEAMANTLEGVRGQIRGISADIGEHGGFIVNQFVFPVTRALKEQMEAWSQYFGELNTELTGNAASWEEWWNAQEGPGVETTLFYVEALTKRMTDLEKAGYAAGAGLSFWSGGLRESGTGLDIFNSVIETTMRRFPVLSALTKEWLDQFLDAGGMLGAASKEQEALNQALERSNKKIEEQIAKRERLKRIAEAEAIVEEKRAEQAAVREEKRQQRADEALAERYRKQSLSDEEKRYRIAMDIGRLQQQGLLTLKEEARIRQTLADEEYEELEVAKRIQEREKAAADQERLAEQARKRIAKLDERIAKEERGDPFKATVTSLEGLYTRQLAAASSEPEDDIIAELKQQRRELVKEMKDAQTTRKQILDGLAEFINWAATEREDISARWAL